MDDALVVLAETVAGGEAEGAVELALCQEVGLGGGVFEDGGELKAAIVVRQQVDVLVVGQLCLAGGGAEAGDGELGGEGLRRGVPIAHQVVIGVDGGFAAAFALQTLGVGELFGGGVLLRAAEEPGGFLERDFERIGEEEEFGRRAAHAGIILILPPSGGATESQQGTENRFAVHGHKYSKSVRALARPHAREQRTENRTPLRGDGRRRCA